MIFVPNAVKVYVAEVTHPSFRGVACSLYPVFLNFGLITGFILVYAINDWQMAAVAFALPGVIYFIMRLITLIHILLCHKLVFLVVA